MLIGLDGIPLTELKTGVGHYTAELARALAAVSPESEFDLVYPSVYDAPPEPSVGSPRRQNVPANLRTVRVPVGALGRHWWAVGLPRFVRAARTYDLFHGTNFDVPLWGGCASVMTVHDLSVYLHPETHERRRVLRARRRLPLMARAADAIITPTEAVRREAVELLRVSPEKVFAVHEAPREVFRPLAREECEQTLRALGVRDRFILAVGTIEPRKNLSTLLRAFAGLLGEGDDAHADLQLVVAGRTGWLNREFAAEVEASGVRTRIRFTGYVPDETLRALYSACRAFIYPSVYEGFGLPTVEAMACGAPVVCARASALVEVAGGAALHFEPRDASALARTLNELLTDDHARRKLSEAGLARAAQLTWERTARATLGVYEEALKRAGRKK